MSTNECKTCHGLGRVDAVYAPCPDCEPAKMIKAAQAWMLENHGRPLEMESEDRDKWCEKFGLLVAFVIDEFPEQNAQV